MLESDNLHQLEEPVLHALQEAYDKKVAYVGEHMMKWAERMVMIGAIDHHWRRHLTDLDVLREGIGLMAVAQRDPLVEYKREAFDMWEALQDEIKLQAARNIFRVQPPNQQAVMRQLINAPTRVQAVRPGAAATSKPEPVRKTAKAALGRNDPCWCGSGKKYKNCHLKSDERGDTQPA